MCSRHKILSRKLISDHITPVSAYAALGKGPYSFLLESVERGKNGRYSFIGFSPRRVYVLYRDFVTTLKRTAGGYVPESRVNTGDPVGFIGNLQEEYALGRDTGLPPFCGGLVGYAAYEIIETWEKMRFPDAGAGEPLGVFMFIDESVAFDHLHNTAQVIKLDIDGSGSSARNRLDEITELFKSVPPLKGISLEAGSAPGAGFVSGISREDFCGSVEYIKDRICAGEIIQGVLSQRLEGASPEDPLGCYRALRVINPSPYMFYLKLDDLILCGSSPEVLVKLDGEKVFLKPIAGTRPRAKAESEDLLLQAELEKDEKERAEHVMLVDLGRNDLARVCVPGSVRVNDFMAVERYSHVMHMVSEVSGRLRPGTSSAEVFKSCFPAGTVSGAPKLRAIEIISGREKSRRGPYAGAAGYFSFTGGMDMCISIRTMVIRGGRVFVQAGAGIVKDSVPGKEYEETLNKARALLEAVDIASSAGQK